MIDFSKITGFDWDTGNYLKSWQKHSVAWTECEEAFFNMPIIVHNDIKHSKNEDRYYLLGRTNLNRKLFVVFTVRLDKIRVISARDMSKKERMLYEKNTKI